MSAKTETQSDNKTTDNRTTDHGTKKQSAWRRAQSDKRTTGNSEQQAVSSKQQQTTVWLDFSLKCGYLGDQVHRELSAQYDEIGRMLGSMIASPEKF